MKVSDVYSRARHTASVLRYSGSSRPECGSQQVVRSTWIVGMLAGMIVRFGVAFKWLEFCSDSELDLFLWRRKKKSFNLINVKDLFKKGNIKAGKYFINYIKNAFLFKLLIRNIFLKLKYTFIINLKNRVINKRNITLISKINNLY